MKKSNNCPRAVGPQKVLLMDFDLGNPLHIRKALTINTLRPMDLQKKVHCEDCEKIYLSEDFKPITYELLIQGHEQRGESYGIQHEETKSKETHKYVHN